MAAPIIIGRQSATRVNGRVETIRLRTNNTKTIKEIVMMHGNRSFVNMRFS